MNAAVVVVVAATVLLAQCAALASASLPPTPTTYRPLWSTNTHAAPPTAIVRKRGQPAGGRQSVARGQPESPSKKRPLEAASSGAERVVLQEEEYQGETRLVYRLAPGAIFAGVRTPFLPNPLEAGWQDTHGDGGANSPQKYSRQEDRLRKAVKPSGPTLEGVAPRLTLTRPQPAKQSYRQPQHALRLPPRRWAPLEGLRTSLATLSTASLGAVRGVRLILMLLQYIGIMPHLPGFPRYEDPVHRRPSIQYTLDRGEVEGL